MYASGFSRFYTYDGMAIMVGGFDGDFDFDSKCILAFIQG
jgi:hypothetical protein